MIERKTGKQFACKVLSKELIRDPDHKTLIDGEIRAHRKLHHANIVEFIKYFEDPENIYMILSICTNKTLKDLQKKQKTITLDECRYFMSQALRGVSYMHKAGYIHRDLKLNNILLDDKMQVKIGDFGLAISIADSKTKHKSICGTTNYLAPEVFQRKGFSIQSDIWAIGVVSISFIYSLIDLRYT